MSRALGCLLFAWVFLGTQLYADATLQLFFIVTSIIGWWNWSKGDAGKALPVRRTQLRILGACAQHFQTAHVPEFGRELWEAKAGQLVYDDMLRIAREQVDREQSAARRAHRYVFCDTSPLTTLFYSLEMFGRADPALRALARRPYHAHVLCAPDFEFIQDGTRRDAAFRQRQHTWYLEQLGHAARGASSARVAHQVQKDGLPVRKPLLLLLLLPTLAHAGVSYHITSRGLSSSAGPPVTQRHRRPPSDRAPRSPKRRDR